jgi:cytochrome oxidase Cu insertion factor (SCO1/SenC/PrrC family)
MKIKPTLLLLLVLLASSCTKSDTNSDRKLELKSQAQPVQVGEMAPDFTLEDQNGENITLSRIRGTGPTVLAFYRGNW